MDPTTDLPPMTADPFSGAPPPATTHPPYPEMITAAITALKDKDGSSRQAISKYIEKEFANLPPTHSTLLTHHLKRLKNLGQLVMLKHSYMLAPRSGELQPVVDVSGSEGNVVSGGFNLDSSGSGFKRKPGRPPKLKPVPGLGVHSQVHDIQADTAPYHPRFQYHAGGGQDVGVGSDIQGSAAGGSEPLFASLGLGDDGVVVQPVPAPENANSPVVVKRGRGRPPKSAGASAGQMVVSGAEVQAQVAGLGSEGGLDGEIQGIEVGPGRGRKPNGVRVKRGRGRPRRVGFGAVTVPLSGNLLRPRGRPKRVVRQQVVVNGGAGEGVLGSRRRRQPSRNVTSDSVGKSLGSLSKVGPGTAVLVTDPEQLVVYQELKSKYEHLQSKVKQVASMVKSCIDREFGNTALGALQELEDLAAEVNGGGRDQAH